MIKKLNLICQIWIIRPRQPHRNKIKTNYEAQFLINPTLKDETKKNKIKNLSQPVLARHTLDSSHKIMITLYKANQNKL